jgi:hypothetical protein
MKLLNQMCHLAHQKIRRQDMTHIFQLINAAINHAKDRGMEPSVLKLDLYSYDLLYREFLGTVQVPTSESLPPKLYTIDGVTLEVKVDQKNDYPNKLLIEIE